jgi:hypothetical protein
MAFPTNPSIGALHTVNDRVWLFNGYAWNNLGITGGVNGSNYVRTFNGHTGDIVGVNSVNGATGNVVINIIDGGTY